MTRFAPGERVDSLGERRDSLGEQEDLPGERRGFGHTTALGELDSRGYAAPVRFALIHFPAGSRTPKQMTWHPTLEAAQDARDAAAGAGVPRDELLIQELCEDEVSPFLRPA